MTVKRIYLLLIVLQACLLLPAQQIIFKTYTIQDGLIANPVRVIHQDKKGFLWIGTWDGISKYDGHTVYEVELEKGDMQYVVHYGADGSVLKKKERKASKVTPMAAMVTDFETRHPNAAEVTWYSYSPRDSYEVLATDWDANMDASDYEVHFVSDGISYVSYYDDGAWIRSESNAFDRTKLPTVISDAINKDYSGYTIQDVDREDKPSQVLYEVELIKGTQKCKVHYGADGTIVKKKCRG